MARRAVSERGVAIRVACDAFGVSESCYRYEARHKAENDEIADWFETLAKAERSHANRFQKALDALAD